MTRVAGVVALLTFSTYGGLGWLAMSDRQPATGGALLASFPVLVLVGMLILRHRPGHGVGFLFVVAGISHPLSELLDRAGSALGSRPLEMLSAMVFVASWVVVISLMLFFAPDGDLPSPRWRPVVWIVGAIALVGCVSVVADPVSPTSGPLWEARLAAGPNRLLMGCLLAGSIVGLVSTMSLATRWQRADPDDRWRLVLLLVGGSGVIGVAAAAWTAGYPLPMVMRLHEVIGLSVDQPGNPRIAEILEIVQVLVYPVVMYVAVVKDAWFAPTFNRIRLLAYTALTITAVVVYALTMSLVMRLPNPWDDSLVPLVGGAVVLVVVVQLRSSLEGVTERMLFGHRRSVAGTLGALDAAVTAARDPLAVLPAVADALRSALRVQSVSLFTNDGSEIRAGTTRSGRQLEYPMAAFGQTEGRLTLELRPGDRLDDLDCRVVETVIPQITLLMRSMRLAGAAQAATKDIAAAREWERARLRRDLHDGLGPVLAGLTLQVDALAGRLHDADTRAVTTGIKKELTGAMEGVRAAIEGLGPGGLDRLGLLGLLAETARSLSSPRLDFRVSGHAERCHPAVEVAAYRIATEAMTNAVRHSGADTCDVTVGHDGGMLDIIVVDNGLGIRPDSRPGVGMSSMRARAEELGGSLRVLPGTEGGTVVHASLPARLA